MSTRKGLLEEIGSSRQLRRRAATVHGRRCRGVWRRGMARARTASKGGLGGGGKGHSTHGAPKTVQGNWRQVKQRRLGKTGEGGGAPISASRGRKKMQTRVVLQFSKLPRVKL